MTTYNIDFDGSVGSVIFYTISILLEVEVNERLLYQARICTFCSGISWLREELNQPKAMAISIERNRQFSKSRYLCKGLFLSSNKKTLITIPGTSSRSNLINVLFVLPSTSVPTSRSSPSWFVSSSSTTTTEILTPTLTWMNDVMNYAKHASKLGLFG